MMSENHTRATVGVTLVAAQFLLIGVLAALAVLTISGASGQRIPVFAWVAVLSGGGLGVWAVSANRPGNFNIRPAPRAGGVLITTGPYRFVRHPMYGAVLLCGAAAAAVVGTWTAWTLLAALFAVLLLKARVEERWMIERHPDYAGYRLRSKRFIPGVF